MPAGFPVKADYASGDVLTAAQMNDLSATVNYLDPTAKGDLFPASSGTALSRLAVGANDTVLTADSSTATGLKWAPVAAGGGMTLLSTTTLSGTSTTISSISQAYKSLYFVIHSVNAASSYIIQCLPNNSSTLASAGGWDTSSAAGYAGQAMRISGVNNALLSSSTQNAYACRIENYASTTSLKPISHYGMGASGVYVNFAGCFRSTTEITSLVFNLDGTTFTGGTVLLYGVS